MIDGLAAFARALANRSDVGDVLYRLADHVVGVLDLDGAGVSLADTDGALHSVTSINSLATAVEEAEERLQEGPCVTAFGAGEEIAVTRLAELTAQWPRWGDHAGIRKIEAVLAVPLQVKDATLGAISTYSLRPRTWAADELLVARLFADIAASYVGHRGELADSRRTNEQLQTALDSRVIIEQAKGVLANELDCEVDQAFQILRNHARRTGTSLRMLSHSVVHRGFRPPATECVH